MKFFVMCVYASNTLSERLFSLFCIIQSFIKNETAFLFPLLVQLSVVVTSVSSAIFDNYGIQSTDVRHRYMYRWQS